MRNSKGRRPNGLITLLKWVGGLLLLCGVCVALLPYALRMVFYAEAARTTEAVASAIVLPQAQAFQHAQLEHMQIATAYDYSAQELEQAQRSPGFVDDLTTIGDPQEAYGMGASAKSSLDQLAEEENAGSTTAVGDLEPTNEAPAAAKARPAYLLSIPAIGLKIAALPSRSFDDMYRCMRKGAAIFPKAPSFNSIGNVCISGHRSGSKDFFRNLNELAVGDKVYIYTAHEGSYQYEVIASSIIEADDWSVTGQTVYPALTLLSCQEYQGVSHGKRIMVRAKLVAQAK